MSSRSPDPHLAANLRRLRLERGLTQLELAERAGVAKDTVNKLEREQRKVWPRTLGKLAQALDVQPGELLKLAEQEVYDLAHEGFAGAAAQVAEAPPEERQRLVAQDREAAITAMWHWLSRPESDFGMVEQYVGRYVGVRKAVDGDLLDLVGEVNELWREAIERWRQS